MNRQNGVNDISLITASIKKKLMLIDNQNKNNSKYKLIIDNQVKSINKILVEIKGTFFIHSFIL